MNQNQFLRKNKNIGAEVLRARLAKILNILTARLTTCLCKAREHVAKSGESKPRTSEITAQVQGNYPNFKQNLAEKNCHHKSQ